MKHILFPIITVLYSTISYGYIKQAPVYNLDHKNQKLLYHLKIKYDDNSDRPLSLQWLSPHGPVDTESNIHFENGKFHSYSYTRHNISEESSVRRQADKLIFTKTYQGETQTKEFPYSSNFVTGSLAFFYMQQHWQELNHKGRLPLRFGVLDLQKVIDFEAIVSSHSQEQVKVLLQPESFIIKMFVNPIEVLFSKDGKKILSISGRTLPVIEMDGKIQPVEAEINLR